jgi:GAF domain-containing protein
MKYMDDGTQEIVEAVAVISRVDVVPTLLKVLCEITGMRVAVVARVADKTWTACAVKDDMQFGLEPGAQFPVDAAFEALASSQPLVIENASTDPLHCRHPASTLHPIESYVSAPIILANGHHFGNLSALDPNPVKVGEPGIVSMFEQFAALIAAQLDNQRIHDHEHRHCSRNAPQVYFANNSLRFWVTTCAIRCTLSTPAAICWSATSPIRRY